MTRNVHFAWVVLVGLCIMVGLGKAGINNTAGLFFSPISEDLGISVGNLSLYLSISSIITMIFLPIGGKIMAKYNARVILIVAIILQAGSFALFGLMNSVWGWYIFAIPLAVGGVFITVISGPVLIERWFKKRSGLALGIMTAIGGLFGVFTQPIVGNLINNLGWRSAYHAVGIAIIVLVVPTILFLLSENPKAKGIQPYGAKDEKEETAENVNQGGIAFSTAKKSLAFILLALFFFIVTAVSSFSIHTPTYLVDQGYDVTFAGNVMSAMMVGVFIGSLLFGYLSDKIGAKRTSLLAMVLGLVSMILLVGLTEFVVAIIIALTLFGFMTASVGTIAPAMTSALFGSRDYSQIYSTASMGLAVASIIALPTYGYIFDFTGSYTSALYIIMVLFVANIIFTLMAFRNRDKMIEKGFWE